MHKSVMDWTAARLKQFDLHPDSVLEVGSLDENGSVSELFSKSRVYVGVDMRDGPGVDHVMNAADLQIDDDSFDLVISTEMIEHDKTFWLSMQEMGRVLKPGGYLMVTGRGNGFPLHAYPDDFFRFMPSAAPWLMELAGCETVNMEEDWQDPGIFVMGRKPA